MSSELHDPGKAPFKLEFIVKETIGDVCSHSAGLERVDFKMDDTELKAGYVRGPVFKLNALPPVPGLGHWTRGGEHEGKFELINKDIGVGITVRHPWCESKEMERWLVETLQVWPHPNAPMECDEAMCPGRRQEAYAHLMNSGKMTGETKVDTE